ncbi:hypothetical protein [Promicromonospora sp. MEB111]|uniref:hypothetical protein n=1 Tax=Promicromonospora sp. MEB111 TaxID=3040301 RepID=UPI002549F780|nr:hypothetical protein [Promicromonospora sp. MEB111]
MVPGWSVGRTFYKWHLTFDDATAAPLHELVGRLQEELAGVERLYLIPQRWPQVTMQGLGFTDEVSDDDVKAITRAAAERLAAVPAFELTLGPI